jgi:hypothetical protein
MMRSIDFRDGITLPRRMRDAVERTTPSSAASRSSEKPLAVIQSESVMPAMCTSCTSLARAFCACRAKDSKMAVAYSLCMARTSKTPAPMNPAPTPPRHFLRAWRDERQFKNQAELGSRLPLPVGHDRISKWETGASLLTEENIYALADALRLCNPGDLFRDPRDQDGVWAIANRIAALSPERRSVVLDALTGIEAGDKGSDDAA